MERSSGGGNLGTFVGVFMPSILTILGIILFLRLGFVVGNAGLRSALVIIVVATAVSVLTSMSLAAIATNMEVGGGGDYYLISRTLGIEFGGAIGIVLFLAQAVSIAFYAIGFGEAVAAIVGWQLEAGPQIIAGVAVLALFVLAWMGADAASRFQGLILVVLLVALVSIYAGAIAKFDGDLLAGSWNAPAGSLGFWATFAIFFPAVTGFTQGVSMSGDLRDPGKSLPVGTFAAVGLSTVVYVTLAVLLAGTVPLAVLSEDTTALRSVASIGFLVAAGVIAATLSSAMASFLGAPRILQSLASDRVFPALHVFAKGEGPTANPRRGVLLSLVIALATISLGNLNVIAPIVSMFFLISYGLLNYATYYEATASSPSFRPRFRYFDRRLSLLGALACLGAMLAISPLAGGVAVVVMFGIHAYLARRPHPERWADAAHSHYFQRAKQSIRQLASEGTNSRNWRPQVLAFSADPARRLRLMRFAAWLEGASGLSAVAQVVQGSGALKRRERAEVEEAMRAEADAEGLDVLCLAVLAPDAIEALPVIVQSFGVGPIGANTVLFGWPEHDDASAISDYRELLQDVMRLGKNVVAVATDPLRWEALEQAKPRRRRIDVWWNGDDASRLALLTAYLFTRTQQWSKNSIRLVARAAERHDLAEFQTELEAMLDNVRIPAGVLVVDGQSDVRQAVGDGDLVLVPMRLRSDGMLDPDGDDLMRTMAALPLAAAIAAGAPVDLTAGPETEATAALRAAEERSDAAQRRLRRLEAELQRADGVVARLRTGAALDPSAEIEEKLEAAEVRLATVQRRTLKARAVAEIAAEELTELIEAGS